MKPVIDHRGLIDALGGNTAVSAEIEGCTPVRVGQWKINNRIPVEYWPEIIKMAVVKGLAHIDSDWMMTTFRPRAEYGAKSDEAAGEAV